MRFLFKTDHAVRFSPIEPIHQPPHEVFDVVQDNEPYNEGLKELLEVDRLVALSPLREFTSRTDHTEQRDSINIDRCKFA